MGPSRAFCVGQSDAHGRRSRALAGGFQEGLSRSEPPNVPGLPVTGVLPTVSGASPSGRGLQSDFLGPTLGVSMLLDTGWMRKTCWPLSPSPTSPKVCSGWTPAFHPSPTNLQKTLTPCDFAQCPGHHADPMSWCTGRPGYESETGLGPALTAVSPRVARLPTGQLLLDLRAPGPPQEADGLPDAPLPPGLQLVGAAPEDQVAQGAGRGLLHVLVGAAQEVHQLADATQLIDLGDRGAAAPVRERALRTPTPAQRSKRNDKMVMARARSRGGA